MVSVMCPTGFLYSVSMSPNVTPKQNAPRPMQHHPLASQALAPSGAIDAYPNLIHSPYPILQTCGRPLINHQRSATASILVRNLSFRHIETVLGSPNDRATFLSQGGKIRTRSVFGTGTCVMLPALSARGVVVVVVVTQRTKRAESARSSRWNPRSQCRTCGTDTDGKRVGHADLSLGFYGNQIWRWWNIWKE